MRDNELNKVENLKQEDREQEGVEENQVRGNDDLIKKIAEKDALLAQKEKELAELQDKLLRIQAEFANYRKRSTKEKEELFHYACCELVEKLLPVLDNLERAMLSLAEQNEETQKTFIGLQMIAKQFKEILRQEGLTPIEAVGADFDPHLHEAVMQVPAEDGVADNQVVEEIRKGYCFKDKVLRVSMVKVAKCE
jgi:molecular chaperone GrpE